MLKIILAVLMLGCAIAHGQISNDEAMERLRARQAAHAVVPAAPVSGGVSGGAATQPFVIADADIEDILKTATRFADRKLEQLNDSLTTAQLEKTRAQITSEIIGTLDGYSGQQAYFGIKTDNVFDMGNGQYLAIGSCDLPMAPALKDQYYALRRAIEVRRITEIGGVEGIDIRVRTGNADAEYKRRIDVLENKYNALGQTGRIVVLGGAELMKLHRKETLVLPVVTIDRIVLQGSLRNGFVNVVGGHGVKWDPFYLGEEIKTPKEKIRCITSATAYVAIGKVRLKVPTPPAESPEAAVFELDSGNTKAIIR